MREKNLEREALQTTKEIPQPQNSVLYFGKKIPNSTRNPRSEILYHEKIAIIEWLFKFIININLLLLSQLYYLIFRVSSNHHQPTRVAYSIEFLPQILYQPPNCCANSGWKSARFSKVSKKTFNWRKGFLLLQCSSTKEGDGLGDLSAEHLIRVRVY